MKKLTALICVIALSLTLLASCRDGSRLSNSENLMTRAQADENQTYNFTNGSSAPNSYTSYKNSANSFAFTMLKNLYSTESNTAFSPASLYSQLSLLQNAAGGDAQKEIKTLTGKNISLDELNCCNGYFFSRLEALSNKDKGYYVDIKNNIFFNSNITVGQSFLVKNANFYNHGLFRLDCSEDKALEKINNYICEQTDERVKTQVSSLDADSGITLTGTAYFKDRWLDGYPNEKITADIFNGSDGDKKVNYMESTEYFLKGDDCTGFIKDFKDTPCRFIALLPNEDTTLYKFINSLDGEKYSGILDSMDVFSTCRAYLPQFSCKGTLTLNNALKNAGADIIFTPQGDFSGLSFSTKASVESVTQSFSLSFTAGGVATSKANASSSTKKEAENRVKLSRPFVYIIADNESNIPIYIGATLNI